MTAQAQLCLLTDSRRHAGQPQRPTCSRWPLAAIASLGILATTASLLTHNSTPRPNTSNHAHVFKLPASVHSCLADSAKYCATDTASCSGHDVCIWCNALPVVAYIVHSISFIFHIAQGMLAELHNLAMQVNMRGALSDDYRIRHPNAPKMVQWHSGQDSCTCDSCCGPASIYRLCFAKDMLCLDC